MLDERVSNGEGERFRDFVLHANVLLSVMLQKGNARVDKYAIDELNSHRDTYQRSSSSSFSSSSSLSSLSLSFNEDGEVEEEEEDEKKDDTVVIMRSKENDKQTNRQIDKDRRYRRIKNEYRS